MARLALVAVIALAACGRPANRADSTTTTVPAVDTLRATAPSETLATPPAQVDTPAAKAPVTKTKSKVLGRDSAFGPPRNLPQLDTVRRRPPG
jgi:hypothetical protein